MPNRACIYDYTDGIGLKMKKNDPYTRSIWENGSFFSFSSPSRLYNGKYMAFTCMDDYNRN